MVSLPPHFESGGIAEVLGVLMEGVPLSGLGVKATDSFFLIGLSSIEGEMMRNTELLKDRSWFEVPFVYTNGRRAILVFDKGTPGGRVFNEAFAAWGQP